MLEVDGVMLSQSFSIARFLGNEFGRFLFFFEEVLNKTGKE